MSVASSTGRSHLSTSKTKARSIVGPSPWLTRMETDLLVLSTALKLLLFPSYRSTDFEVHRNWLAITSELPRSRWYYDTTSEWTLDYPPFFAYFELALSYLARAFDPVITRLGSLNYASPACIAFQRTSVLATEVLVLGSGLLKYSRTSSDPATQFIVSVSLLLHPGFIIVDHIHFQVCNLDADFVSYNGVLFGLLIWSLWHAKQGNHLMCGVLFAVLLNFKHIYMYLAPPYFVYLLRAFCYSPPLHYRNLLALGSAVLSIFFLSLAPFARHLPQLASRLFPFTRGLNHAYWAGNTWALVTLLDRALLKYGSFLGLELSVDPAGVRSSTRGLVVDTSYAVLPNVKPIHCFLITIGLQSIFLGKLFHQPTYRAFLWALTMSGFTSFMFGWHVHEKAVLVWLVPLSLLATYNAVYYRIFVIASVSGIVSLFPLLFTPMEVPIKLIYTLTWCLLTFKSLSRAIYLPPPTLLSVLIHRAETSYLLGFLPLLLYVEVLSPWLHRMSGTRGNEGFLPLMSMSVWCALGMAWSWVRLAVEGMNTDWTDEPDADVRDGLKSGA